MLIFLPILNFKTCKQLSGINIHLWQAETDLEASVVIVTWSWVTLALMAGFIIAV
jgi:hypothetical protein